MKIITLLFAGVTAFFVAHSQTPLLQSGPMLGYVEMREACVWVQTTTDASVTISYWDSTKTKMSVSEKTLKESAYTTHLVLTALEPGVVYNYEVAINGTKTSATPYRLTTQSLWQYRTDPPDFRLATGSCAFINEQKYDRPGKTYGGGYEIFESIHSKNPDVMLWLGDNVYLREVDWNSKSGIIHRYTHSRSISEVQPLLSSCAHYAIWDDHDFGPNDSNGSFIHKDWTLECFKMFWANSSYGIENSEGITSQFTWSDIDFFLLDNRYHRTEANIKGIENTILGNEQITWLIQALKYSKAPFKMVAMGGQFLNPVAKFENYAQHAAERERILKLIDENNITGVVFLTGDRHCGEFSELILPGGNAVYDLTVSPLTSSAYDNTSEENTLRVAGSLLPQRNFATIDFSGKRKERKMTITTYDASGTQQWQHEIMQPKEN